MGQQVIERVADVDRAGTGTDAALLVVAVTDVVPGWLAEAVERAHRNGRRLAVRLGTPPVSTGEPAAGWEIGVVTSALAAGADDVLGAAPRQVARVREVLRRWQDAAERVEGEP